MNQTIGFHCSYWRFSRNFLDTYYIIQQINKGVLTVVASPWVVHVNVSTHKCEHKYASQKTSCGRH